MKSLKNKPLLELLLILGVVSLTVYVLAQQTTPTGSAGKLSEAITLLNTGKPAQANEVIASIAPSDHEHAAAQGYKALCLYELKDTLGFLKTTEAMNLKQLPVSREIGEDLAFKQIDVLFYFRKFDDLLPKIQSYWDQNPSSPRVAAVTEYYLAALFERGMKKTYQACQINDTNQFFARWAEGKADLEKFLAAASSSRVTNYSRLQKRSFAEDVWVARLTMGDEKALFAEIPIEDQAAREKVNFLRVQLYQKMQPNEVDRNLKMMADFVKDFPESQGRKRVEFDMASISFPRGEQLCKEADLAEKAGDSQAAARKRELASRYFETLRTVQSRADVDKASGIEPSDIFDLRADLLYSYYLEKNDTVLASLTVSIINASEPGDLNWMVAKVYEGIRLASQTPPADAATKTFDEVLAFGFRNKPDHDYYALLAVRWRSYLALRSGDRETVRGLYQRVEEAACAKNLKKSFLTSHAILAGSQ